VLDILSVDRGSEVPIHRQIYAAIRGYVLNGRCGPATRLPATRLLAQHLGVGRNTVIAAYEQLLAEGYVEARSGSGTWVARLPRPSAGPPHRRPPGSAMHLSRRGELIASRPQPQRTPDAINLHPGVPETAKFPYSVWAGLLARIARRHDDDIVGIHGFAGHPRLRQAIADYLGVARGVDCTAEQVIVVTGAQAALDLASRILMDEGEPAWMEEPGYLGARSALIGGGARLAPLRVDQQGWRLNDPDLPPPRVIYVTPSCQWPFGTIMRMDERLQLLAVAARHGSWILEDDYDGEYRFRGRPVPALRGLDGADRVIHIGTFGKTLFPSLRLGFLVVPSQLTEAFNRTVSVTGQFAPTVLQVAVAEFIRQGYFARHLRRMRRLYASRQDQFVALCRRELGRWLDVSENDSGMQLFGRFQRPLDDCAVAAAALRHGVDVQPVSINYFHDAPQHGLLLGYAALDETLAQKAIKALRTTFEDLEPTPGQGSC
jgi:GntR family transcriptional regulator/MocR family aminotransferase